MRSKILSFLVAVGVVCMGLLGLRDVRSAGAQTQSAGQLLLAGRDALAQCLRQQPLLDQLAFDLLVAGGMREYNQVLLGDDRLLYNLEPPKDDLVEENLEALLDYLEQNSGLYFTLIPTACAIEQEQVSSLVPLFNQRRYIGDMYDRLYGLCSTVDVYQRLWEAREQYLYYRTDTNLTGLGGFTVYQALAERMGLNPRSLDQFEMEHLSEVYQGNLAYRAPRFQVQPDRITLYRFSRFSREYRVSHWQGEQMRDYYSLFPSHLLQLQQDAQQILLGGISQRIDIETSSPYDRSLLVLGDETALAYLPFLAVHFEKITFLDLEHLNAQTLPSGLSEYDMQLMVLQLDTWIHCDLTRALQLVAAG